MMMHETSSPDSVKSASADKDASSDSVEGRDETTGLSARPQAGFMSDLVSAFGYILAVSYPVLALSTGTRAVYQLFFKEGMTDPLPAVMSGIAALCYLVAAFGFAYRRRWTWWLSVLVLGFETSMTLLVGVWSYIEPDFFGRTVWRHFGQDYGYFPLFQPLIGLVWLFWPGTRQAYAAGADERAPSVEPGVPVDAGSTEPAGEAGR